MSLGSQHVRMWDCGHAVYDSNTFYGAHVYPGFLCNGHTGVVEVNMWARPLITTTARKYGDFTKAGRSLIHSTFRCLSRTGANRSLGSGYHPVDRIIEPLVSAVEPTSITIRNCTYTSRRIESLVMGLQIRLESPGLYGLRKHFQVCCSNCITCWALRGRKEVQ